MVGFAENSVQEGFAKFVAAKRGVDRRSSPMAAALNSAPNAHNLLHQTETLAAEPSKPKPKFKTTKKPPQPEEYAWPSIIVGRLVDARAARPDWKIHQAELERRSSRKNWQLGEVSALGDQYCPYFTPRMLNDAFTERYPDASKSPDDSRRQRVVDRMRGELKTVVRQLASQRDTMTYEMALNADADELRQRSLDPDNRHWYERPLTNSSGDVVLVDQVYWAEQHVISNPTRLWSKMRLPIEQPDSCGKNLVGYNLLDLLVDGEGAGALQDERTKLVSVFQNNFGFNPSHFGDPEWTPQLVLFDDAPSQLDGLRRAFPAAPNLIPLEAPTMITMRQ